MHSDDIQKDIEAVNRAIRACEADRTWSLAMNKMSGDANRVFVRALDMLRQVEDRLRHAVA